MSYGGYSFVPVPFISINKEFIRAGDGELINAVYNATLDGTLVPIATGVGGLISTTNQMRELREAFGQDGQFFNIKCDDTTVLECRPRITTPPVFPQSNDNWVNTIPFTIGLSYDLEPVDVGIAGSGEDAASGLVPPFLNSISESWSAEFIESPSEFHIEITGDDFNGTDAGPYTYRLTHAVAAQGRHSFGADGTATSGWVNAKTYVDSKLGYDANKAASDGGLNFDKNNIGVYNASRSQQIDQAGGNYSVTENWLGVNTGIAGYTAGAIEDFTMNVNNSVESAFTTITVNGSIQGLEVSDFGTSSGDFAISTTKYSGAAIYFDAIRPRISSRAIFALTGNARNLNVIPLSFSIGRNPSKGSISYNYTYNDRPLHFISNALTESIVINDSNPTDVFAEIVVLGRAVGPILQDINTVTSFKRSVSVNLLMPPYGGGTGSILSMIAASPSGQVNELILCPIQTELSGDYSQLFKNTDSESWDGKTGAYSRQVQWTLGQCGGSVDTSVC